MLSSFPFINSPRVVNLLRRFQLRYRRAIVVALLLHVLAIVAMASLPGLHEAVHHDAHEQGHECAVTLFASGTCDAPTVTVLLLSVAMVLITRLVPRSVWVQQLFLIQQVLEHGPPSA